MLGLFSLRLNSRVGNILVKTAPELNQPLFQFTSSTVFRAQRAVLLDFNKSL